MPVGAFFAVNIAGTMARLYLIRRFGTVAEEPLDSIVEWIGDNRAPLLVLTVGLTVLSIVLEARKGETEVEAIVHLDDELEAEADAAAAARQAEAAPSPDAGTTGPATAEGADGSEGSGGGEGAADGVAGEASRGAEDAAGADGPGGGEGRPTDPKDG